mmetsp:Transcript_40549/g.53198  ORF Transcript_40549/g.53198 Transcript_40549/m.53198 type:complete len:81 (-) Transcript_40549:2789-3031(-)
MAKPKKKQLNTKSPLFAHSKKRIRAASQAIPQAEQFTKKLLENSNNLQGVDERSDTEGSEGSLGARKPNVATARLKDNEN